MTAWLTSGQACQVLEVSKRTLNRYVVDGRVAVRINREGRGRLYCADGVAEVLQEKRAHARLDYAARKRATQRALWRLKELHPELFALLRLEELAKERGSPAATGNPPTSTFQVKGT